MQEEVRRLQAQLRAILGNEETFFSCSSIQKDLYFGMTNSSEVYCLQEFLSESPDIYPEGLVTGNFLNLTKNAVIRFQEKHSEEILSPLNLSKGTGYVGEFTLRKINQMLGL